MSLEALRRLRRSGAKPDGVVSILIGSRPAWCDDDAGLIVIRGTDQPAVMDLRPLVGLWVALYSRESNPALTLETMDALQAAGARFFGAVLAGETHPCVSEPTDAHHIALRQQWEALCQ